MTTIKLAFYSFMTVVVMVLNPLYLEMAPNPLYLSMALTPLYLRMALNPLYLRMALFKATISDNTSLFVIALKVEVCSSLLIYMGHEDSVILGVPVVTLIHYISSKKWISGLQCVKNERL